MRDGAAGGDDGGGGAPAADAAAAPPFGDQLRRARRAVGLTQEELAERARLSARAVSDLERGAKRAPRPETLRRLAAALELAPAARAALEAAAQPVAAPPGGGAAPPGPRHNLPAQLTSFVGRERELAAVREALAAHRLVTLTGPGGVGKTRLALAVPADALEAHPDGVWLAELAALADPALVPQAVARAVGVPEAPGRPPLAALTAALKPRGLLLVLDNCEHLLDACARLADALLRACLQVRILCTSREALGIAGETVWRVPSLPVPAAAGTDAADGARPGAAPDAGGLARYAAVALFVERAAAVRPEFALTAENAPAVAQVCVRLDGIPLALELAAARVRVLPPRQLLARLDDRFRLLTGGSRTALERHQTLQAAVDWSHALLTDPERALFARLAVFAGGWTLEAAEAVGADRPDGPEGPVPGGIEAPEVLDLLTRLVDQSLVLAEAEPGGAARYRQLETLRQYAAERLEQRGERKVVCRRHAGYFLGLAERAAGAMHGPDQGAWFDRLERERDNLRAALGWALGHGDARRGLRFVEALRWFWEVRGDPAEGRRQAEALLALPALAAAADPGRRARALAVAAHLARAAADRAAAVALGAAGAGLAAEAGARRARADALLWLAMARFRLENSGGAGRPADGAPVPATAERALLEESLALWRDAGEPWGVAQALEFLGAVTRDTGDPRGARPRYEAALALRRELRDARGVAETLCSLANLALRQGEHAAALARAEESLVTARALGDRRRVASALNTLSLVAQALGDVTLARRHLEAQLAVAQQADVTPMVVLAAYRLAALAAARGEDGVAGQLYLLALRRCVQRALPQGTIACLAGLAAVALARGQPEPAARLLGAAEAGRAGVPDFLETTPFGRTQLGQTAASARTQFERTVAAVRRGLAGRAGVATWLAVGRLLPLERAAAEAGALAEGWAADGAAPAPSGRGGGPPSRGAGPLTPREREVAVLVARGRTNRQIAAELVIAERTAMRHVEHVFTKLGAHSRAEVGAWAAQRGLLGAGGD